ncbi:MAG TPA: CPBP family intramembrane glutamic endopeptidase [Candidatus Polarisedimenticolia bacterium]|nr:CPBP family intramembrane glutamic endopeptidase [Candidatus Polarisedimenticolia bacterium]
MRREWAANTAPAMTPVLLALLAVLLDLTLAAVVLPGQGLLARLTVALAFMSLVGVGGGRACGSPPRLWQAGCLAVPLVACLVCLLAGRQLHETLLVCAGAPVLEEMVYRGLALRLLRRTCSFLTAASISSAAFWVAHLDPSGAIPSAHILAAGLFLAWVCERTGSVLAPLAFHSAGNAAIMLAG